MAFFGEFKKFALKGNVIDLAVGVVIGAAFSAIVKSLVDDIITPAVLNPLLKRANLTDLSKLTIEGTAIKYGNFLSNVISFFIVALVLFLIVKLINKIKSKEEEKPAAAPAPTKEEALLAEIRDILKAQKQ